jgi:hypothetical protein
MQPMSARPRATAGLKRPPLIRKKTQALTARLKPNASEMYISVPRAGEVVVPSGLLAASASFATWAPAKAKKRKRNVPRNSPIPCDVLVV